jgi:hypothetical protein
VANIGLYYPFIRFKDERWLKLSALYWDKMARIVPPSYARVGDTALLEGDSATTKDLIQELDFVVNVPPNEVTYPVSDLFGRLLIQYGDELRTKYDVRGRDQWPVDPVTQAYAQLRNPHLAYVNSSKLHDGLVQQLEDASLAMGHREEDLWIGMHPRLARCYMAALAEEVAAVNALHPTTNETINHLAATGWSVPRLAAALLDDPKLAEAAVLADDDEGAGDPWSNDELRGTLAILSIRAVIPRDPDALTVAKIVELRSAFGPQLSRFQAFIDETVETLPQFGASADPGVVAAHLEQHYTKHIGPLLNELQAALRGQQVDTVASSLNTSVAMPAALSAIPVVDPVTFAAGAALSLFPVLRARRRQGRDVYTKSPVAYLYRLEEGLQPHTLLGRVRQGVQKFLTGV